MTRAIDLGLREIRCWLIEQNVALFTTGQSAIIEIASKIEGGDK